jgi:hypothetical protein
LGYDGNPWFVPVLGEYLRARDGSTVISTKWPGFGNGDGDRAQIPGGGSWLARARAKQKPDPARISVPRRPGQRQGAGDRRRTAPRSPSRQPRTASAANEFEYPIPIADGEALLEFCAGYLIDKVRHRVDVAGRIWEIDVFEDENAGLVIAEVELGSEGDTLVMPEWAGREITEDRRYYNAGLARLPFTRWS